MAQRPLVDPAVDVWGQPLNDHLDVSINLDGTLKESAINAAATTINTAIARVDPGSAGTDGAILAFGPGGAAKIASYRVFAKNHNVVWDGVADDTAALSNALAVAVALGVPLVLPPGTGMVTTLTVPSNASIIGPGAWGCTIKQHGSAAGASTVTLTVANTNRVSLSGFTIDGNKAAFAVVTEHKHGLDASGASNLTLNDLRVLNPKGDGIYFGVGTTGTTAGIRATNVTTDGAYRNGVSIISMDDGLFTGCSFLNSSGTNPQSGLDIEPNFDTDLIKDIRFVGCTMAGNASEGVIVTLKPHGVTRQGRIRFANCAIRNNGASGALLYRSDDVIFRDCDVAENALDGYMLTFGEQRDITISGGSVTRNGNHGINVSPDDLVNIQNIAITGNPTGGTFTLTFDGQTTGAIAWNATKEQVQTALEALPNVAPGDLVMMTGPLPANLVNVTFKGAWAGVAAPLMTANSAGLTGGAAPTVVVTIVRGRVETLRILDVNIEDNGKAAANTYDGIILQVYDTGGGVVRPVIRGVRSGNVKGSTQRRGLSALNLVTALVIEGNDFQGNLSAPLLSDIATGRTASNNLGITTVANFAAAGTALNSSETIQVNPAAASPFTLTLPADPVENRDYNIVNTNGNTGGATVTVVAAAGHTIRNSGGAVTITTSFGFVRMRFRVGSWFVVAETP